MNIYDYIESTDIAAHCQRIGHLFNPLDIAVLVDLCDKPLKEKLAVWRTIIEECPDMPINKRPWFEGRESLHAYLCELIAWHEKAMIDFYAHGQGVTYRAEYRTSNLLGAISVKGCYSTVENAWAAVSKEIGLEDDVPEDELTDVRIVKEIIDSSRKEARFNTSGEMMWHDYLDSASSSSELSIIFINIPVPFNKGDLIEMSDGVPGVLIDIPHWRTGEPWASKHRAYSDMVNGKLGDGTDMCASYYRIGEDGRFFRDHDQPKTLHRMRYYTKELQGSAKFLRYVSDFLHAAANERDTRLDWLISAFCKCRADTQQAGDEQFLQNFLPLIN